MKLTFPGGASAELVTEVVSAALANAGTPCGDSFIDPDKTCRVASEDRVAVSASRFRPKEQVEFSPALEGPSGAKLVSYQWQYRPEEYVDKRGEDRIRRVSDWERAAASAETGRDLVHHFTVRLPDGQERLVSAETVPQLLGYADKTQSGKLPTLVSATKTLAKLRMAKALHEAHLAENDRIEKEVKKLPFPEVSSEPAILTVGANKGQHYGTSWKMGDAWVLQRLTDGPPDRMTMERRETLEYGWRKNREKDMGWKHPMQSSRDLERRIKRQEAKIKAITTEAANEFTEELHPRDNDGRFTDAGAGTESAAFKEWFQGSMITEMDGKPLVMYHGTGGVFNEFDSNQSGKDEEFVAPDSKIGYFFTSSGEAASHFAWKNGEPGSVIPVYLSIKNPLITDFKVRKENVREFAEILKQAKRDGHDGAAAFMELNGRESTVVVAFKPEQIKSKFNRGTWSKTDKNIGNDGGVPCGDSYISSDKVCRVGEGVSVPALPEGFRFEKSFGRTRLKIGDKQTIEGAPTEPFDNPLTGQVPNNEILFLKSEKNGERTAIDLKAGFAYTENLGTNTFAITKLPDMADYPEDDKKRGSAGWMNKRIILWNKSTKFDDDLKLSHEMYWNDRKFGEAVTLEKAKEALAGHEPTSVNAVLRKAGTVEAAAYGEPVGRHTLVDVMPKDAGIKIDEKEARRMLTHIESMSRADALEYLSKRKDTLSKQWDIAFNKMAAESAELKKQGKEKESEALYDKFGNDRTHMIKNDTVAAVRRVIVKDTVESMLTDHFKGKQQFERVTKGEVRTVDTYTDSEVDKIKSRRDEAEMWFNRRIHPDVIKAMNQVQPRIEMSEPKDQHDRAYYNLNNGAPVIRLTKTNGTDTIIHELGHHIEATSALNIARGMGMDFVYDRATTEPLPLRRLTGYKGYRADEMACGDRFTDVYVGKVYEDGSHTEVLSMGLQSMYANPESFYQNDREHFLWTLYFMHGGGSKLHA